MKAYATDTIKVVQESYSDFMESVSILKEGKRDSEWLDPLVDWNVP